MWSKHFAVAVVITFLLLLLHTPIAKAQQENTAYTIDAKFEAVGVNDGSEIKTNNIGGDPNNITTEIDIWEQDLGKQITDGSYVGPLFESSLFEVDFTPKNINQQYTYTQDMLVSHFMEATDIQKFQDLLNDYEEYKELFYRTWPDITNFYATLNEYMISLDLGNNPPGNSYSFPIASERSIVSLTQVVNFSNRVIMSGATEFWVKIPIDPSCVNFEEMMPTINFMPISEDIDMDKLWIKGRHKIVYSPVPQQTNWVNYVNNDNYWVQPAQVGRILPEYTNSNQISLSYGNQYSIISQFVTEKYKCNNNLYVKIYAPLEPNQEYIVSFTAMLNSKPKIYVTSEDLYNEGRESYLQISNLEYGSEHSMYYDSTIGGISVSPIVETYTPYFSGVLPSGSPPVNDSIEIPLDMSFSFIFKSGRGAYGMYGQSFEFEPNESIVFYDEVLCDSNQYISQLIPFISDKSIEVDITVEFISPLNTFETNGDIFTTLIPNYTILGDYGINTDIDWGIYLALGSINPVAASVILLVSTFSNPSFIPSDLVWNGTDVNYTFSYKKPFWWQSEKTMTYEDYILFTVPYKPSVNGNKVIKTIITFIKHTNITFMFSTLSNTDYTIESSDLTQTHFNNYNNNWYYSVDTYPSIPRKTSFTYIYDDVYKQPIFYYGYDTKYSTNINEFLKGVDYKRYINNLNDNTMIHSKLFRSVQMTNGIWHQYATDSNGVPYATNFFERRIAVGIIEYNIDTTNKSSQVKSNWWDESSENFGMAWEALKKGDLLGAVKYMVRGVILGIWNGLQAFMGWIKNIFVTIWDTLVKVGKFIKQVLQEFWGEILSIIEDLVSNAEKILEIALYVIAIIIFAYVISWTTRFIYLTKGGMDD